MAISFYTHLVAPDSILWSFSDVILNYQAGGYGPSYVNGNPNNLILITDGRFHLHQDSPYEHNGEIILSSELNFKITYEFGPDRGGWPSSDQDFGFHVLYNGTGLGGFAGGGYWWPDAYICFEKDIDTQKARMIVFLNTGRWPDETAYNTTRWNTQLYSLLNDLNYNWQSVQSIDGKLGLFNLSTLNNINDGEETTTSDMSDFNLTADSNVHAMVRKQILPSD